MAAGGVLRVIVFGFQYYHFDGKKRTAQCKTCHINISDSQGTTSIFVGHLKSHVSVVYLAINHLFFFYSYEDTH